MLPPTPEKLGGIFRGEVTLVVSAPPFADGKVFPDIAVCIDARENATALADTTGAIRGFLGMALMQQDAEIVTFREGPLTVYAIDWPNLQAFDLDIA